MLSSSIPKYVKARNTETIAFPGKTVIRVNDYIRFGELDVSKYSRIIIHLGTNDLCNLLDSGEIKKVTAQDVLRRFKRLRDSIRRRNSRALLIFASLLPRYSRFKEFLPYVYGLNFAIEKWCAKSGPGTIYLPTYRAFLNAGKPMKELYAADGLHLNGAGVDRLEAVIQQALSSRFLADQIAGKRRTKLTSLTY